MQVDQSREERNLFQRGGQINEGNINIQSEKVNNININIHHKLDAIGAEVLGLLHEPVRQEALEEEGEVSAVDPYTTKTILKQIDQPLRLRRNSEPNKLNHKRRL